MSTASAKISKKNFGTTVTPTKTATASASSPSAQTSDFGNDRHPSPGRKIPWRPHCLRRSLRQPDPCRLEISYSRRRPHPQLRRLDRPRPNHRQRPLPTRPPRPLDTVSSLRFSVFLGVSLRLGVSF